MRGGASLLVLALVGTFLAGCADDPDGLTAMEAERTAREAAHEVHPGAVFVGILTAEARDPGGFDDDEIQDTWMNVGQADLTDGRAEKWLVLYLADGFPIEVLVEDQQTTVRPGTETGGLGLMLWSDAIGMDSWRIDSHEAMAAAVKAEPRFADIAAQKDSATFLMLLKAGGNVTWLVAAANDAAEGVEDDEVLVFIDAATGEAFVADLQQLLQAAITFRQFGSGTGQLTALAPTAQHGFEVDEGHQSLTVLVAPDDDVPLHEVRFSITAPDGTSTPLTGAGQASVVLEGLPGSYTLHASLDQGVLVEYDFHWCTDGVPTSPGNPACPF